MARVIVMLKHVVTVRMHLIVPLVCAGVKSQNGGGGEGSNKHVERERYLDRRSNIYGETLLSCNTLILRVALTPM